MVSNGAAFIYEAEHNDYTLYQNRFYFDYTSPSFLFYTPV